MLCRHNKTNIIDDNTDAIDITSQGSETQLILHKGKPFVEIRPGKGVEARWRANARYVNLPDFFADDIVYDPRKTTLASQTVHAENIFFLLIDNQNTILMCTWAGSDDNPSQDQKVELKYNGRGDDRKAWARIAFQGRPIHVALLECERLWHDDNVSSWPAYTGKPLDWERPFEAKWRADFIVADGRSTTDWKTRIQSFPLLGPNDFQGAKVFSDENRIRVWMESLGYVNYPCYFLDRKTFVRIYVDKDWRTQLETGKIDAEQLPNIYERVLLYPLDRNSETPATVFTPADIMRETLGLEPCEYVLNREKIRADDSPLFDLDLGVCATIDKVIAPVLEKQKNSTMDKETKTAIVRGLHHILSFMQAVSRRIKDYRMFGVDAANFCSKESARNPGIKPLADKILKHLEILNTDKVITDEGKVMKYERGSLTYWEKSIPELIAQAKNGQKERLSEIFVLKEGLAQAQDRLIGRQRRCVKAVRQEAMQQRSDDLEARKFADEILKRCNNVLHNRHPKEGV
ncbi:MAG: hypothetical protein C0404_07830 [Verrucomicrobia bacterium]|nr:hypothetical protein [Verrucomicrobiota bacterium]